MITKPSTLPRWATGGGADITEPSIGEKSAGWVSITGKSTAQYWNWYKNNAYDWVNYLVALNDFPRLVHMSARTSAVTADLRSAIFAEGLFVASGGAFTSNNIMTSTDGDSWTLRNNFAAAYGIEDIAYDGADFVGVNIVGGNTCSKSADGITWINGDSIFAMDRITNHAGGYMIASGIGTNDIEYSTDAFTSGNSFLSIPNATSLKGCASDGTYFMTVAERIAGNFYVQYTQDLPPITSISSSIVSSTGTNEPTAIIYDSTSGLWIIGMDDGEVFTSSDRSTWTSRGFPTHETINRFAVDDTGVIAGACDNGTIIASNDGLLWNYIQLDTSENLNSITVDSTASLAIDYVWVAIGDNSTVFTSY